MKKLLALFPVCLLSACVSAPSSLPSATVYDFGLPATRTVENDSWQGLVLEVKSPAWADSTHIQYRLAYENSLKRHEYAESRWAGTPAVLIEQRLRQQLGIVASNGNGATGCRLGFTLEEFSQVFDSPRQGRGVLQASVSLIDSRRELVAGRRFRVEKATTSPDAQGGVVALISAGDELGRQVSVWLEKDVGGKGVADCRRSPR